MSDQSDINSETQSYTINDIKSDISFDVESEIKLPFENKKSDLGEWVYVHRIGLCVTLIIYLLIGIVFVSAKISLATKQQTSIIEIDLQQLAELERQRDELQKAVEELHKQNPTDWDDVQNQISNESMSEESQMDNVTEQLLNEAAENQRRMEANRAAYEQGMAEAQSIKTDAANAPKEETKEGEENQDGKVQGNVTVSYLLYNPIRHSRKLIVPSYRCQGGGEVVINIVVNQGGEVISAKVKSGGDECMQQAALSSAMGSLFDINKRAPARHSGTITYIFIPQ